MVFEVQLSLSAEKDLENAILYQEINKTLLRPFNTEFEGLITLLEAKPYFQKKYDRIRTCNLRSFPYVIHFIIYEEIKTVVIIAVAFGKQGRTDFRKNTPDLY